MNIKIEKAAQMLRETTLTHAEIATEIGFENEFYFSRIFKNKMGCTASVYRRKEKV